MSDAYKQKLSASAAKNLEAWLNLNKDPKTLQELQALIVKEDWQELEDAFYCELAIGTGGIRGKIGPGTNRINFYTIGRAAQGLADFIASFGAAAKKNGVVVGYDVRRLSKDLAEMCCDIFLANGIATTSFPDICSTPEVSFMVRYLRKTAGVMITASHNPRTDNGFKFYWSDGGQVVAPNDALFMDFLKNVVEIKRQPAGHEKSVDFVTEDTHNFYIEQVSSLSLVETRSAKIVFSPIHGSGITNVLPVLQKNGFDVTVVPEQAEPNGEFPTAHGELINPEFQEVSQMALDLAAKLGADLAIISDPDADRAGIGAKESLGSKNIRFFNGNEIGVALTHFILTQKKQSQILNSDCVVMEANVTTSLVSDIAKSFSLKVYDDLLVGFKFIAEIIEKEQLGEKFIFAAEESLGYLRGTFVRDKDAAITALTVAEMVSYLKDQGLSLTDYLNQIYREYGYYRNRLHYMVLPGKDGSALIRKLMLSLRQNSPASLAGLKILKTVDRLDENKRVESNYITGMTGDQLAFIFTEDGRNKITIRPSGTEPKVKIYTQVYGDAKSASQADQLAEKIEQGLLDFCETLIDFKAIQSSL